MIEWIQRAQENIFWLNLIAMAIAAVVNTHHAIRWPRRRWLHAGTAVFAAGYMASYVLFLTGVWTRLEWSEVMIVPSLVTIGFVWIVPAVVSDLEQQGDQP